MEHGITGFNMWQKSIAQSLPFWGSFDEACNIHHIQESRHFTENNNNNTNNIKKKFQY